jgi:hypothetical protein
MRWAILPARCTAVDQKLVVEALWTRVWGEVGRGECHVASGLVGELLINETGCDGACCQGLDHRPREKR